MTARFPFGPVLARGPGLSAFGPDTARPIAVSHLIFTHLPFSKSSITALSLNFHFLSPSCSSRCSRSHFLNQSFVNWRGLRKAGPRFLFALYRAGSFKTNAKRSGFELNTQSKRLVKTRVTHPLKNLAAKAAFFKGSKQLSRGTLTPSDLGLCHYSGHFISPIVYFNSKSRYEMETQKSLSLPLTNKTRLYFDEKVTRLCLTGQWVLCYHSLMQKIDAFNITFPLDIETSEGIALFLINKYPGNPSLPRAATLIRVLDGAAENSNPLTLTQMNEMYEVGIPVSTLYRLLAVYWKAVVTKTGTSYRLNRKELKNLLVEEARRNGNSKPRQSPKTQRLGVGIKEPTDILPWMADLVTTDPELEIAKGVLAFVQAALAERTVEFEINGHRWNIEELTKSFKEETSFLVDKFMAVWFMYLFLSRGKTNPGVIEHVLEFFPPVEFNRGQQDNFEKFWNWYTNRFPR